MLLLIWKTIQNISAIKILTGVMVEKGPKQHKNKTRKIFNGRHWKTTRAWNTYFWLLKCPLSPPSGIRSCRLLEGSEWRKDAGSSGKKLVETLLPCLSHPRASRGESTEEVSLFQVSKPDDQSRGSFIPCWHEDDIMSWLWRTLEPRGGDPRPSLSPHLCRKRVASSNSLWQVPLTYG